MAKDAGIHVDVEWEGLDELIDLFERYEEQVPQNVTATYAEVGQHSKQVMDVHTPVDTGHLKSRNQLETEQFGFTLKNDAEYSAYVEYGTTRMSAQPYLAPATEFARQELSRQLPKTLEVK